MLLVDACGELLDAHGRDGLAGERQPLADPLVLQHGDHIGGDLLAQGQRHVAMADHAQNGTGDEGRETRLHNRRDVGRDGRPLGVIDGDDLDLAALFMGAHGGVGHHDQLQAIFAEIHGRCGDVAIGDFREFEIDLAQEAVEDKFGEAGRDAIAHLVRIGPRKGDEFLEIGDADAGRHGDGHLHTRHAGDGRKVFLGIVTQILMHIGMHHIGAGRPEEKDMIILGAHHSADGDQPVAARLAFDNHRLAPEGLQLVDEQARGDVGAGAGSEGQDEAHGARGPGLRRALGDARRRDCGLQDEGRRRRHDETAQLANHGSSGWIFDFQLAIGLRMICPRGLVKRARLEALNACRGLWGEMTQN